MWCDYLLVLPPLERMDELPPPDRMVALPLDRMDEPLLDRTDEPLERMDELLPLDRMDELLLDRVDELLLDRMDELVAFVRVALETEERLVVAVDRDGVATVLFVRREDEVTELLRAGVLEVRVVTDCERVLVFAFLPTVARSLAVAVRLAVAVVRPLVACVIRSLVRTLLLPNVLDVALLVDTRVAPSVLLADCVLRIVAVRVRSICRALVMLRDALRELKERSGWRVA